MKKIIILITICVILICLSSIYKINSSEKEVFKDNYFNIIYKEKEVGITFIFENNVNAILINNNQNKNILIVLDYDDINSLKKELKKLRIPKLESLYNIRPIIIDIYGLKSKEIKFKNNIIKLKYNSKNFCIYSNASYDNSYLDCDFIYMYKFNKSSPISFSNKTSIVFQSYNNLIPIKISEELYQNWIDVYTLNSNEYLTLKILKDGFDTIVIPIIK